MPVNKANGLVVAIAAVVVAASPGLQASETEDSKNRSDIRSEAIRTDWSTRQLDAFAAAVVAVGEARALWRMRIANADTVQQAEAFRARMIAEIESEIAANGLTVETYNKIFTAARADPRLYREIEDRIDKVEP